MCICVISSNIRIINSMTKANDCIVKFEYIKYLNLLILA